MKPGSCTLPCLGIDAGVLDPHTGRVMCEDDDTDDDVQGVLCIRQPWHGMAWHGRVWEITNDF
jgi:acyl-coenzyme A synthetase/AMP-(fatty) acid ligase